MRTVPLVAMIVTTALMLTGCAPEQSVSSGQDSGLCGPPKNGDLIDFPVVNGGGTTSRPFIMWGVKEGCFAAQGIDIVNLSSSGSNAEKLGALIGRKALVAAETPLEWLSATENQNTALEIVVGIEELPRASIDKAVGHELIEHAYAIPNLLVSGPGSEIDSFQDLAGARIGTLPGVDASTIGLHQLLEDNGLSSSDIDQVPLGTGDRLVALERGDIDAGIFFGASAYSALDAGGVMIGYPRLPVQLPGVQMLWYTTSEVAVEHRASISAFKRAVLEINSLLVRPENAPDFVNFMSDEFGLEDTVAERFGVPPLMNREITAAEVAAWSEIAVQEGLIGQAVGEDRINFFDSDR